MHKAPLSKHETLLDDLLHETDIILSNDERLAELNSEQLAALSKIENTNDLEIGKPVAIILFWHAFHCIHCGATHSAPRYGKGAMLKRWFARRRIFVYEPLVEYTGMGYDDLTHRIETSHSDVTCCQSCFHENPNN